MSVRLCKIKVNGYSGWVGKQNLFGERFKDYLEDILKPKTYLK